MAIVVGAAGIHRDHTTLDVPQRQFLLHMQGPGGARQYEHHVGLFKLDGARWITIDSSRNIACDDLAEEDEIIPLGRAVAFPLDGRPISAIGEMDVAAF